MTDVAARPAELPNPTVTAVRWSDAAQPLVAAALENHGYSTEVARWSAAETRFFATLVAQAASPQVAPWRRVALASARRQGVLGIALDPHVFLRDSAVLDRRDILLHETVHVAQFRRDGRFAFLVRYGWAWGRGRLRGMSHHEAYLAIPYEVDARAAEAEVQHWPRTLALLEAA